MVIPEAMVSAGSKLYFLIKGGYSALPGMLAHIQGQLPAAGVISGRVCQHMAKLGNQLIKVCVKAYVVQVFGYDLWISQQKKSQAAYQTPSDDSR